MNTAIKEAIKAYSIAVAPQSSTINNLADLIINKLPSYRFRNSPWRRFCKYAATAARRQRLAKYKPAITSSLSNPIKLSAPALRTKT
jgi:hypothetical protein